MAFSLHGVHLPHRKNTANTAAAKQHWDKGIPHGTQPARENLNANIGNVSWHKEMYHASANLDNCLIRCEQRKEKLCKSK